MTVIALLFVVVAFCVVFAAVTMLAVAAHWLSVQIAKSLERFIEFEVDDMET
jgi:hypothetical protein